MGGPLSQCPHCFTVFRVTAEQLELAEGLVRCGACRQVFAATEHWVNEVHHSPDDGPAGTELNQAYIDEILGSETIASIEESASPDQAALQTHQHESPTPSEPIEACLDWSNGPTLAEFQLFYPQDGEQLSNRRSDDRSDGDGNARQEDIEVPTTDDPNLEVVQSSNPIDDQYSDQTRFNEAETPYSSKITSMDFQGGEDSDIDGTVEEQEHEEPIDSTNEAVAVENFTAWLPKLPDDAADPLLSPSVSRQEKDQSPEHEKPDPDWLAEIEPPPVEMFRDTRNLYTRERIIGTCAAGLLIGLLFTQYFWFERERLARLPRWRPAYERVCDLVGCNLPPYRDLSRIRDERLTVVESPENPGVLLAEAQIVNFAPFAQDFPLVELSFSNIDGQLLSRRAFTPEEYLGRGWKIDRLLQPGEAAQFSIAVIDPGQDAVNYRIRLRASPEP